MHGELVPLPGLHGAVLHPLLDTDLELGDLLLFAHHHHGGGGQHDQGLHQDIHLVYINEKL